MKEGKKGKVQKLPKKEAPLFIFFDTSLRQSTNKIVFNSAFLANSEMPSLPLARDFKDDTLTGTTSYVVGYARSETEVWCNHHVLQVSLLGLLSSRISLLCRFVEERVVVCCCWDFHFDCSGVAEAEEEENLIYKLSFLS